MEYMLIHKPVGYLPPEVMKFGMEQAKNIMTNTQAFVPGGKCTASYTSVGTQTIFCLWDLPNVESIAPVLQQMKAFGWNTEIIPIVKSDVAMAQMEKMMQEAKAPAIAR